MDFHGIFPVTLNVSDAAGNWDTDTFSITVLDITSPIAIAGPNQIVAEGTLVTFDASGSRDMSGIVSYAWNFTYNGTLVTLDGASASFQFWTPGTYRVTLTVLDAAGNRASDITTATVQPFIMQENTIWTDGYGWLFISLSIALILLAAALLVRRRKKVVGP
jgi:hypothetical protein